MRSFVFVKYELFGMGLKGLLASLSYCARNVICPKLSNCAVDMTDVEQIELGQMNTLPMTTNMYIIEIKSVRIVRGFLYMKQNSICMSFFTLINTNHTVTLLVPSCHTLL